jgi:hypothetical protein
MCSESERMPIIQTAKKGPLIGCLIFLFCALSGFSVLIYRDMTRDIPPFDQLEVIKSEDLTSRAIKGRSVDQFMFEMKGGGKRLLTKYMDRSEAEKIQAALLTTSALVYAGTWDAPFPSEDIRSVYHIEIDGVPLLDYKSFVDSRDRDKRYVWIFIAAFSTLVVATVIFVLFKRGGVEFFLKLNKLTTILGK